MQHSVEPLGSLRVAATFRRLDNTKVKTKEAPSKVEQKKRTVSEVRARSSKRNRRCEETRIESEIAGNTDIDVSLKKVLPINLASTRLGRITNTRMYYQKQDI